MRFIIKTPACSYCGTVFTLGPEEQRFFAIRGNTNNPRCCPRCRSGRKAEKGGDFGYYASFSML